MKEKKGYFEIITSNFTFVLALLVVIGILQINDYYRDFYNFDVMPYLSTSEVLTQSFISLSNFSLVSLLGNILFLATTIFLILRLILRKITNKFIKEDESGNFHFVIDFVFLIIAISFGALLFQGKGEMIYIWNMENISYNPLILFVVVAIFYSVTNLVTIARTNTDINGLGSIFVPIKLSTIITWYLIFSFILFTKLAYKREGIKIKVDKIYMGSIVKTSDATYLSDSSSSYVGRTSESVFIYDFVKKSMLVIPGSEVKSIKIVTKY